MGPDRGLALNAPRYVSCVGPAVLRGHALLVKRKRGRVGRGGGLVVGPLSSLFPFFAGLATTYSPMS